MKWVLICQQVEKEMLEKGWKKHSDRFEQVKMKIALERYTLMLEQHREAQ